MYFRNELTRLNCSAWIVVITSIMLPYQERVGLKTSYGYPLPYIIVDNYELKTTLIEGTQIDILIFVINIIIVFAVIYFFSRINEKVLARKK